MASADLPFLPSFGGRVSIEQGSTLTVLQGCGHALPAQVPERYNAWLEEVIMSQPIQS